MSLFSRRHFLQTTGTVLAASSLFRGNALVASPSMAFPTRPLIFAHRGASALRPEHTLAAYGKAIIDGADYIEPDLVPTKDGRLIARHESNITDTTDVAQHPEFANRRRIMTIDGKQQEGWFTTDFTFAEIKQLRACERLPQIRPSNSRYNGWFDIPSIEEVIDFVAASATASGRQIGIIPELKNPTHFHKLGFTPEDQLLDILNRHNYTRQAPVEIQSFEPTPLRYIRKKIGQSRPNWKLMFLLGYPDVPPADILAAGGKTTFRNLVSKEGLQELRGYADAIGPANEYLIPKDSNGQWLQPTNLIQNAHDAGLFVHSYTCRPENIFLPRQLRNQEGDNSRNIQGSIAEIRRYLELGLDGFFTDDPAVGRLAIEVF